MMTRLDQETQLVCVVLLEGVKGMPSSMNLAHRKPQTVEPLESGLVYEVLSYECMRPEATSLQASATIIMIHAERCWSMSEVKHVKCFEWDRTCVSLVPDKIQKARAKCTTYKQNL